MKNHSTNPTVSRILAVLLLGFVAACAAPAPPNPSASSMSIKTTIAETEAPVSGLAGQILEPLIEVGKDGSFQPGLAESWTATTTFDRKYTQVDFVLPSNWTLDNNSSIPFEYIPEALQNMVIQLGDDPGLVSSGDAGGNPCIIPITTSNGIQPVEPFSVLPADDDRIISIIIPLTEACRTQDATCVAPSLNFVASAPIFNPDTFDFKWRTEAGLYVFEDQSGMIAFDPQTHVTERCSGPECERRDPSSPRVLCTPVPKGEGQ